MKSESQRGGANLISESCNQSPGAGPVCVARLFALFWIVLAELGCHSSSVYSPPQPQPFPVAQVQAEAAGGVAVAGQTLVYRFPTGRTYQAEYGCEQVHFVLLQPELSPAPSKTMPFTARSIRPGLDLVVWEDPEFHTTLVVDFERGMLHASALLGGTSLFLGQAEIVEMRATRDAAGEDVQCFVR